MFKVCIGANHVPGCEHFPCRNWVDRARNFILPPADKSGSITFAQAADLRRARRQSAVNALRGK